MIGVSKYHYFNHKTYPNIWVWISMFPRYHTWQVSSVFKTLFSSLILPVFRPHHQLRGLALKHYIIRGTNFSFKYIKIQTKIKNIYSDSNDEEVLKYFFCYAPFMLMSSIFLKCSSDDITNTQIWMTLLGVIKKKKKLWCEEMCSFILLHLVMS